MTTAIVREMIAAPSASLRLTVLDRLDAVEQLRPAWEELLSRSSSAEPMLSPDWLLTWWRVYSPGSDRQLRVGVFQENDRIVGLAPLLSRRFSYRFGIPFRRIEPLGADVDEGDGVCSEYLTPICETRCEELVAHSLVENLARGRFGPWDEFVLPAMDGEAAMPDLLLAAFQANGIPAEKTRTDEVAYIPLSTDWDSYLKSLPQRKRYVVTRSLRDFESWAGQDAVFSKATTAAELEESKRVLKTLHSERWNVDGELGAFHAPRFSRFHDEFMARALEAGRLELVTLKVRGEPVAAVYNIVANGKVYFYQSGRSVNVPKEQRLGIVILSRCIRNAIEQGVREFDLLGGTSQYKSTLAPRQRPLVQVRAVKRCVVEGLRRFTDGGLVLTRRARQWLRSGFWALFPKVNEPCKP